MYILELAAGLLVYIYILLKSMETLFYFLERWFDLFKIDIRIKPINLFHLIR